MNFISRFVAAVPRPIRPRFALPLSLVVASLALCTSAQGQTALLSFSGGNGTPLSISLSQPVTFKITTTATRAPLFVFQNVGNLFNNAYPAVTGSITYQINGGGALTLTTANTGAALGSVGATDLYFFGTEPGVTAGDTITLSAGTETTTANYTGFPPPSFAYNTFVVNGANGARISAVPEPSPWTLLSLCSATLLGMILCRSRRTRLV